MLYNFAFYCVFLCIISCLKFCDLFFTYLGIINHTLNLKIRELLANIEINNDN